MMTPLIKVLIIISERKPFTEILVISASVSDIKSVLNDLDAEIEEIKNNTEQMYQDIKR